MRDHTSYVIKKVDEPLIRRRAKPVRKKKCKCGTYMPAEDDACNICHEAEVRASCGLNPSKAPWIPLD